MAQVTGSVTTRQTFMDVVYRVMGILDVMEGKEWRHLDNHSVARLIRGKFHPDTPMEVLVLAVESSRLPIMKHCERHI